MKLSFFKRTSGKKGETNRLRREGKIPAVLYGPGLTPESVSVSNEEIQMVIRNTQPGLLSTTVFELNGDKVKHKAVMKDIQYHVATYAIEHIDFVLLNDDVPVTVKVPIQVTGVADSVGVKLGGFMRQAIRTLKVTCLPKNIPQQFVVDVREMNIGQSKRLSEIEIPTNVKPIAKMNEVAVVIAKKAGG